MKADNFSWSDAIYLKTQGLELDMHNCYDFRTLIYDVSDRLVKLEWHRNRGGWVEKTLPKMVEITMVGIDHVRITPRIPDQPFTEDDCLSSFGYDCDEEWRDGQFWIDSPPKPEWRWSFLFQSGAEVIIGGKSASVGLTR